jgi:dihydrodipicolinate reductase
MFCCLTVIKYQQTHNTLASLAEAIPVLAAPTVAAGTVLNLVLVSQARTEFKQSK